jgi:two-component system cit operon sensor histidine kinase CitA
MLNRVTFHFKLFIFLIIFSSSLLIIIGSYYYYEINSQLYSEIGLRAKIQAKDIALFPPLIDAVEHQDHIALAKAMAPLVKNTDASYLVVGNAQGVHLFHSLSPEKVGEKMVGGDNLDALSGLPTITIRTGATGVSLRGKAPIFNAKNEVIGIVSVGYLKSHLDHISSRKLFQISAATLLLLVALFFFSWRFARNIKKQMFFLEPREIGLLVRQQKALLESIYEGVIAIDRQFCIAVVNQAAKNLLSLEQTSRQLRGKLLSDVVNPVEFFDPEKMHTEDTHDELCQFNHLTVIASRVRIFLEGQLQGWVITFRDRNEITELTEQLTQVRRHADNLRILRHEQLNWTAILSGLLHMKRFDDAIHYIEAQSENAQEILDFVSSRFCYGPLCGLLLGKYARAREKGVLLHFDPACQLMQLPETMSETELMSVIGNLLDNAIEATLQQTAPHPPVELYLVGNARELVIEVADTGGGIDASLRDAIFEKGVTSKKQGDHGLGLHLVASYVSQAGGSIEVSDNTPSGTIFTLFIPVSRPHLLPKNNDLAEVE